jgi:hypothetical protein
LNLYRPAAHDRYTAWQVVQARLRRNHSTSTPKSTSRPKRCRCTGLPHDDTLLARTTMDFVVLGPLTAYRHGHAVELGGAAPRAVPAWPAAGAGQAVRHRPGWSSCCGTDEEPPAQARPTVSNHISRLRGRLDDVVTDLLRRRVGTRLEELRLTRRRGCSSGGPGLRPLGPCRRGTRRPGQGSSGPGAAALPVHAAVKPPSECPTTTTTSRRLPSAWTTASAYSHHPANPSSMGRSTATAPCERGHDRTLATCGVGVGAGVSRLCD